MCFLLDGVCFNITVTLVTEGGRSLHPSSVLLPYKHEALLCSFGHYHVLFLQKMGFCALGNHMAIPLSNSRTSGGLFGSLPWNIVANKQNFHYLKSTGRPSILPARLGPGCSSPSLWRCLSSFPRAVRAAWLQPPSISVHLILSNIISLFWSKACSVHLSTSLGPSWWHDCHGDS